MIVKPLRELRPTSPVAVIEDARRGRLTVSTLHGRRCISADDLRPLRDHTVYLLCRPSRLLAATDARQWTAWSWNRGTNKLRQDDGPTVYPMLSAVRGMPAAVATDAIFELVKWLGQRAVIPGSLSSMSWRLWRSTLDTPVKLSAPVGVQALYGGRQEAPIPGDYRDCQYFDLIAAYPTSMAMAPYPTKLLRAHRSTRLDGAGIARATVTIPQMEWAPLPVRIRRNLLCYGWGTAEGFWPWSDLQLARDCGAKVTIHDSWAPVGYTDLFAEWWDLVQEGRNTVRLSKAVTSRLWGGFSLSDSPGFMYRWEDSAGKVRVRVPLSHRQRPIPGAAYIAAETTARVRNRLYREALGGSYGIVYCDTDAVIAGRDIVENVGILPGQWRIKTPMTRCEIRAPQVLRHMCPLCDRDHARWHYTVAGAPTPDLAERIFRRTTRGAIAWAPGQMTLTRANLDTYREAAQCGIT